MSIALSMSGKKVDASITGHALLGTGPFTSCYYKVSASPPNLLPAIIAVLLSVV